LKILIRNVMNRYPKLFLLAQVFRMPVGFGGGTLQSVHDRFVLDTEDATIAVDIGCGPTPQNLFSADQVFGVDLIENEAANVRKARLGFEPMPFADGSIHYVTAYDLLEHIPRYGDLPEHRNTPFVYMMNEVYRVMKKGGIFLSSTPVYPFMRAFQDPTHNNVMTTETLRLYFSDQKIPIANHYGIDCDFKILYRKLFGQHLVAILQK